MAVEVTLFRTRFGLSVITSAKAGMKGGVENVTSKLTIENW